jgi:hypothetical protein
VADKGVRICLLQRSFPRMACPLPRARNNRRLRRSNFLPPNPRIVNRTSIRIGVAWTIASACVAAAEPVSPQLRGALDVAFAALDFDGDQRLSRQETEVDPLIKESFDTLDQNGDGILNHSEFESRVDADARTERGNAP